MVFQWNSTGRTVVGVTAISGTAAHQLNGGAAMSIDRRDDLYIADTHNNRVQKWTPGSTNGSTVAGQQNGASGSSLSELFYPYGVSVDSSGGIYVADTFNHRVVYWANGSTTGRLVAGTGESNMWHVYGSEQRISVE
jgi:sugar lactone lactonase YvrE